ncbi:MAG: DUF1624 domain-containing protein [Oscillospiraceae bacterium]|nr:DUF1624 domain-containing protein [Oscillospiraceae bacterium]
MKDKKSSRGAEIHGRIAIVDIMRSIAVINMICYHAVWDIVNIFDIRLPWYESVGAHIWQQSICMTFILLSGFCADLSRKPLRRGIIVFLAGAAVSFFTMLFTPSGAIFFGILTLIGSCMIITGLIKPLLSKCDPRTGFVLSAVLFVFTRNIPRGCIGFEGLNIYRLPEFLYRGYLSAFFGFPGKSFVSADYFPIIPWMFLFFSGYFFGKFTDKEKYRGRKNNSNIPAVFTFISKNALVIYMLHQPVVYIILKLILGIPVPK